MDNFVTCIAIGPLGLRVLEHLYRQGTPDLNPAVVLSDPDQLYASALPNKLLLPTDDPKTAQPNTKLNNALEAWTASSELLVLVADLNDASIRQAVLQTARFLNALDRLSVAVVTAPQPDSGLLATLDHLCDSVLVFQPAEAFGEALPQQMALAIEGLADLCRNTFETVDFSDVRHVMSGMGRVAVVRAEAGGQNRSEELMTKTFRQLDQYWFEVARVDRVLMQLSYSPTHEMRMREQVTITQSFQERFRDEPRLFKVGYVSDDRLDDQLRLTLLLWTPLAEKA